MTIEDEGGYGHTFKGFGRRLKEAIADRKMKQEHFAGRIGISTRVLSLYLTGERTPRADVLTKMAEVLGVTIDYLCVGTQPGLGVYRSEIRSIAGMLGKLSVGELKAAEDFTYAFVYGDISIRGLLEQVAKTALLLTQERIEYNHRLLQLHPRQNPDEPKGAQTGVKPRGRKRSSR